MTKEKTKPDRKRHVPATCSKTQICKITRDNKDCGDFSIETDARSIWLSEQKIGEHIKQCIEIPRKEFNKLIRWYLRPQIAVRT